MRTLHHSGGLRASLQGTRKISQGPTATAGKARRVPRNQCETFRAGGERGKAVEHSPSFPVLTVAGRRGAWRAAARGVAESQITEQLNNIITATSFQASS